MSEPTLYLVCLAALLIFLIVLTATEMWDAEWVEAIALTYSAYLFIYGGLSDEAWGEVEGKENTFEGQQDCGGGYIYVYGDSDVVGLV